MVRVAEEREGVPAHDIAPAAGGAAGRRVGGFEGEAEEGFCEEDGGADVACDGGLVEVEAAADDEGGGHPAPCGPDADGGEFAACVGEA